jgi:hypothetical protein
VTEEIGLNDKDSELITPFLDAPNLEQYEPVINSFNSHCCTRKFYEKADLKI